MSTERIIQVLLGLVVTMCIALTSFSLKWVFNANAQIATIQASRLEEKKTELAAKVSERENLDLQFKAITTALADMDDSLITLSEDTDDMVRMTKQLQKHWKLHTWTKDQISELRHKQQMPPVSWPDLD